MIHEVQQGVISGILEASGCPLAELWLLPFEESIGQLSPRSNAKQVAKCNYNREQMDQSSH